MKRILAIAALLSLFGARAWAINVDSPDDICAPAADPCVVAQDYDIVDGSVLDFGTRTLQVTVNGVLDTNTGQATILCGSFTTDAGTVQALKVRGGNGLGGIDGGLLTLEARQRCSLANDRLCTGDNNCNFGTCTLKVCSIETNVTCLGDENCDYGTCDTTDHRCTGNSNRICSIDDDCKLGTCTVDVCSSNKSETCTTDDDCNFGTCSVGTATFSTLRPINGNGGSPGTLFIRSAGNITIGAPVTFNAASPDEDGGVVDIESGLGSVTVAAAGSVEAKSGGLGTGGDICLIAQTDITVSGPVDAAGGDFDGGFIEFDAGHDILLNQPTRANAFAGGGFGGEIAIAASNDVIATAPATLETNGHFASASNFGGDGGSIEVDADRTINLKANTVLATDGAEPDGFGGEIVLESGADMTLAGSSSANTSDAAVQGSGGNIDISATTALNFPAGALLDARGAANGGGSISIVTEGPMVFGGTIDARTSNNGQGDSIDLDIGGSVTMSGAIRMSGTADNNSNGQVDFEFCRMTMASGAVIENLGGFGRNTLSARERLQIQVGASVTANASTGLNRLVYRDPTKPPVVNGTVSPTAAANDINPFLVGCPVCGNGELDGGETCEDGNTTSGDGCSADCQDEGCISETPGYPDTPLCSDDDGCTIDTCESSSCDHVQSCDDGVDCSDDSCGAENDCLHAFNDALCNDDNPCTTDICSVGAHGCVSVNNSNTCDDGIACTANDHCTSAVCAGTSNCAEGEVCNPTTGQCQVGGGCGDGITDGTEACDDGDTNWAAGESCDATCQLLLCGDPDDSGTIRSSDALFILRTAVGTSTCDDCVCNVDSSTGTNTVTASDSLRVLRKAVGGAVELLCPVCS